MSDINRVVVSGNLTRDPELRNLPSGTEVCDMRIASNSRFKNSDGEWVDRANYFTIVQFGNRAKASAQHLHKGRGIVVDGVMRHETWEKDGQKREAVKIIADDIKWLPAREERAAESDLPADTSGFANTSSGGDDIPF